MTRKIKIKKGLDIPVAGNVSSDKPLSVDVNHCGVYPADYEGVIWKPVVKVGDKVKSGDALLRDKLSGKIVVASPCAGEITEIKRGERRKIIDISISVSDNFEYRKFEIADNISREEITEILQESGLWAFMRQRPFDIVPGVDAAPRDIFVTAFDSAPLANELMSGLDIGLIENGLKILGKLTEGRVYVGVNECSDVNFKNAETIVFSGPHPSGNVGAQIAALRPVNKGETVFTLDIRTVEKIGGLFKIGYVDFSTIVNICGEINNPSNVKTLIGAKLSEIFGATDLHIVDSERIISGNLLTGKRVNADEDYLRFPFRQITIIQEGNEAAEFMGWASLGINKYSTKRSFLSSFVPNGRRFGFDARIKGGKRAMILSGEYDKVFPFDIYPEYLIKAIIAKDFDKMEQLGIFEVAPEDFALAEFVDTSKLELQQIVRDGLDMMLKD